MHHAHRASEDLPLAFCEFEGLKFLTIPLFFGRRRPQWFFRDFPVVNPGAAVLKFGHKTGRGGQERGCHGEAEDECLTKITVKWLWTFKFKHTVSPPNLNRAYQTPEKKGFQINKQSAWTWGGSGKPLHVSSAQRKIMILNHDLHQYWYLLCNVVHIEFQGDKGV